MAGIISPLAGKPVTSSMLVNVPRLLTAYFTQVPDPATAAERVSFGTSGHRGSAFDTAFNEAHILATTQAICLYRQQNGIDGPLFIGIDTHAVSEAALASAVEVLAANDVTTMLDAQGGYTPTPLISHAILTYNRARLGGLADGVVITPSHNPPEDGGFKYNSPNGGPADVAATDWIQRTANEFLANGLQGVKRIPYARARKAECMHPHDYIGAYVSDLENVLDMDAIRSAGVKIGIDPLGGASVHVWEPVIARYGISATVVNNEVDPTFRFMTADWDGKIRMDCSSPYAMTRLIAMRWGFDVAFANDTDADRHGIVCRSSGLMNPNYYLAVAISYLYQNRAGWRDSLGIGKTVVSSGMIDRVAAKLGRKLVEVPVGFKWFVDGLLGGTMGFGGEESAGASFLRWDGGVWTTDKDGIILGLLAAEITARTGRDPGELYERMTVELGPSFYERIDAAATPKQKTILKNLNPEKLDAKELAGEPILTMSSTAPGNNEPIGGIKVSAKSGWFAARPSGTEEVYKIYAESFRSAEHLKQIQDDAQSLISRAFAKEPGG
ncbi:MAG TPA: phosphoglucomutase (alpha-D-glucose-1,6-bisphosphate-dependent) [Micropepsaceae bacterium]|nr:phosphoglucomutase (alpha-D-glucose-1,6-bisphosphate-dependent) [Micropepsaceae bacterium]